MMQYARPVFYSGQSGNHYYVREKIQEGGFGAVYVATTPSSPEFYAIKVAKEEAANVSLQRETTLLSYCRNSPFIPMMYDSWVVGPNSRQFMVMELLGSDLCELHPLKNGFFPGCRGFSMRTTYHIAQEVLKGLEYLHNLGYVHNDLKLQNFALTLRDHRRIKIFDLGLAESYRDQNGNNLPLARADRFDGTRAYSSLRRDHGWRSTRRDDIESFVYVILLCYRGLPWVQDVNKEAIMMKKADILTFDYAAELGHWPAFFRELLRIRISIEAFDKPPYQIIQQLISRGIQELGYDFLDWEENEFVR